MNSTPSSIFSFFYRVYWKSVGSSLKEHDVPLEIIPSSFLHSADDVTGNNYYSSVGHVTPKVATTVEPGVTCSSFSYASGSAITLATAGSSATFTVTVKDSFDNVKTSTSSTNIVATIVQQGSTNLAAAATPSAVASSPTYTVTYTLTASSSYSLAVLCNNQAIVGAAFSLTVFPSNECGELLQLPPFVANVISAYDWVRFDFFVLRPRSDIFNRCIIGLLFNCV
jgi:hypothetical protein